MTRTLRTRVVLVVVGFGAIPLLIFGLIAGVWSAREMERQSLILQTEIAERVERDVSGFLSTRLNELRVLEQTNSILGRDGAAIGATLERLLAHDQVYQAASLLSPSGEIRTFASRSRLAPEDPDQWSEAPFSSQGFWEDQTYFVSPVRYDSALREPLLDIAVPVVERRTGAVDSVILSTVRFRPIWDLLGALTLPEQTEAFVIDDANLIVAHRSPAVVLSEQVVSLPARPGRNKLLNGDEGLVAWHPLSLVGGTSYVVVTRPLAAALQGANAAVKITVLVCGTLLIAGAAIGLRQANRIVAPVEALVASARRISDGDLNTPLRPDGPEEIRVLGQTLEDMRLELGQTFSLLEQSEYAERQRALVTLQSIGDAVITTDRQGRIVYVNPVAEEVTGWTQEEAQGRPLPDVFNTLDGSTREPEPNPVEQCLCRDGVVDLANNTILVRRDGTERLISDSAAPIRERDDQVVGVVIVFRDTTERNALEEALRQSQKMEAIGQLTAGIAHDFNNLLQVIQGNAELLADEPGVDPDLALPILKATGRGSDLTSRLLSFGRRQSLKPRTVDVKEIVDDMIPIFDRTLGETFQVVTEIMPDIWPVLADPGQLESAILNLILNARDAMTDGGCITIAARKASIAEFGTDHDGKLDEQDFVALSVTDTGTGMSAATLRKAVDPFFTTKGVGQGSGLGLSMVYGFVMQSGGHFEIESEPNKGTMASMFLPRSRISEAQQADSAPEMPIAASGKAILIVEDEPSVRALAMRSLTGLGYRALTAPDVASARSLMQVENGIDLVLTDVVLPGGVSGVDFAIELRRSHPDLPVIFVSGYPRETFELGDFAGTQPVLLTKPFRRSNLAAALRTVLGGSNSPGPTE